MYPHLQQPLQQHSGGGGGGGGNILLHVYWNGGRASEMV